MKHEIEWISVADRLPKRDEFEWLIVSGIDENKRYVHYAHAHAYGEEVLSENIFSIPGWMNMNVTHWAIPPQPPEL